MAGRGLPRRDVTHLFNEGSPRERKDQSGQPEAGLPDDGGWALPLPDPLGILERWTGGRVRDPLHHRLVALLEGLRSYPPFSGHQP